jgi:two-component system sensor histidine kinase KdpD
VFQPFQRLGDKPGGTGVGLGLAVARGFLDAIGATIELDDTAAGGTTAVIRMRIAK